MPLPFLVPLLICCFHCMYLTSGVAPSIPWVLKNSFRAGAYCTSRTEWPRVGVRFRFRFRFIGLGLGLGSRFKFKI